MQIGISTFHNAHNYGAMLQAYGLQEALKDFGYSPFFVDLHHRHLNAQNRKLTPIRNHKDLLKRIVVALSGRKLAARYNHFETFKKNHLRLSRRYETLEELRADPPAFGCFVCGSDQIWNVQQGVSPHFFLDYAPPGARRIAYAPSFGVEEIPQCHEDAIRKLLEGFSAISVRERSGAAIVEKITGKAPEIVLDPVFLPAREKWDEIMKPPSIDEPYLVFYSLEVNQELSALVGMASKALKIPIVVLGKPGAFILKNRCLVKIDSGPAEFLGWIANAKALITNSFHATSFSIIFNIPFAVHPHSTRNTRIEHILGIAGMQNRLLRNGEVDRDDLISLLSTAPHFGKLPLNLDNERSKSIDFLRSAIK